jgi:hypothetical protein
VTIVRSFVSRIEPAHRRGILGLCLLSLLLVTWFTARYTTIGPVDELQHLDYADKISHGHLVASGDTFGQTVLAEEACRGVDVVGAQVPACGTGPYDPAAFLEGGYNTAAIHPPLYYLVTGVGARTILAVHLTHSFVLAARLMGAVWLAAGLVMTWFLLAELGAREQVRWMVSVALVASPVVLYSAGTVNNDGAALFFGALICWAAIRFIRGHGRVTVLAVACAAAVLTKFTFILAAGAAVALVLLASRGSGGGRRRLRRGALVSLAACLGTLAGWRVVAGAIAKMPLTDLPMVRQFHAESLSFDMVFTQSMVAVPPTRIPYLPAMFGSGAIAVWILLVGWMLLAGPVVAVLSADRDVDRARLATLCMAGTILIGPAMVLANFVQLKMYVPIPPRYGLVLVPAMFAVAAPHLRSRVATITMWVVCLFGLATIVSALASA